MKELLIQDRDNNVYPIGTYTKLDINITVPYEIKERVCNSEQDYTILHIYGSDYKLNYLQINKSPRSVYQLSRLN